MCGILRKFMVLSECCISVRYYHYYYLNLSWVFCDSDIPDFPTSIFRVFSELCKIIAHENKAQKYHA